MPTAGLDRGPRSAEPYALPPQVSPPQVHPRAEPTPINGYPASHARMPSSADAPLRAPQPDARPVSPARPPAHGRPETAADANGPWPQNQATPGGSAPATGLPHAGAGHMGAHAGPAAPVRPTFESPQAGQPFRDADSGAAQQPAGGAQHRSADSAPVQRKPVEQDPAPVARLATAGPQTQHHYADADLTPNWFTTKPSPEATTPDAPPAPTGPQNAGPQDAEAAAQANAQEDPSRVVLDLDLVGLLNGMAPEQAIMATPENATGAAAQAPQAEQAPQGPHQDGSPQPAQGQQWSGPAFPSVMPGATPAAAPKPPAHPLRPLSAEDLEAIRWRLDGGTLREVVDDRDALREIGERLDEPLADETDNATRAGLLSVRAEVYRLLGELGLAAAAARLALAHAESAQDVRAMVIAQAELAHVLRLRGDFGEADRLFEQAAGSEAPELLRSVVHENAGRSCFDQGRHMEALDHFARAIRLGDPEDTDLAARTAVCLEAVYIHVLRDGWGPYPRLRREILGQPAAG
jgi:tetratricopeptide (TPR) repeat protein